MKKCPVSFLALAYAASLAHGPDTTRFLGMYLQGQRIGYVSFVVSETPAGRRSSSGTHLNAAMLGEAMKMDILSDTWSKNGKVVRQEFVITSAGRIQKVTSIYGQKLEVTRISGSEIFKKTIEIPKGAVIVDDPTMSVGSTGLPKPGTKMAFYAFDPTVLMLIKSEAEFVGQREFDLEGAKRSGYLVRIAEPRASMEVYVNPKGEMLYATSIFGISMKPITREEALGAADYSPSIDLASATRTVADRPIQNPRSVRRLSLLLQGRDLARLMSDSYQTVSRLQLGTRLDIHPPAPAAKGASIRDAGKKFPRYVAPALNLPAKDRSFVAEAKAILKGEKDSQKAALLISGYVNRKMKPNAAIGMVRDAKEIWLSKEGVCRDYATVAATLMRAAGIPTKIAAGAVYADGAFYYHAWVETWNGKNWLAIDPTIGGGIADATHIKFASGNPDEAFVMFTLEGVKIKVLEEKTVAK